MMRENESEPGGGWDPAEGPGAPPDWGNWIPVDGFGPQADGFGPQRPSRLPPRHSGRMFIYVLVAFVAASLGAAATVAVSHQNAASPTGVSSHDIPALHDNPAATGGLNQVKVEHKVEPGLVDIIATLGYDSETAEGTGMILSSDGLVLTNNHVIDNSTAVTATLVNSGRSYKAKVIGYDATQDVALLRLEGATGLPVVTLGNSGGVTIGTPVLALGNAEGRGGVTPAAGIIDALGRSINASDSGSGVTEYLHNMQQTSAQIQQGDSGGALADNVGQVIGMITAANTSSNQAGGTIGFAIPINTALSIARQISAGHASNTVYLGDPGFLGVAVATSTSANPQQQASDEQSKLAEQDDTGDIGGIGVSPGGAGCIQNETQISVPARIAPAASGALIVNVFCGTSAQAEGLEAGDVVTSVNGRSVTVPSSLGGILANFHPGDVMSVRWTDLNGGQHTASITLGAGPVR
jgi:S1-C subfamily serine protease